MSGKAKSSGVSRSAVEEGGGDGGGGRGDSEPKTKKQRLIAAGSDQNTDTEEELYQKAVSLVFGGELYSKLLRYAGPEGIAHLRGDRKWRKAMDDLPADDLRALDLPVIERPDDVDLALLRQLLTEPASTAHAGRNSGCWTLNELGWKILVRSPLTSNAVIRDVIKSDSEKVLDSISLRPGNSAEVLADLVRLGKPDLLVNIANHRNASSEILSAILVRLPGSKLPEDRVTAACLQISEHENTGELDLNFLSNHEYYAVREHVAGHRSTPAYLLRKLSSDTSMWVRAAVARNCNTPRDKLISLSIDQSYVVRANIVHNPNVDLNLLFKLAMDDSQFVLETLATSHEKHFDIIFDEARKSHRPIIASFSDNSDVLDRFVGMDDGSYNHLVARNPNTSQESLARLATSEDEKVRRGVAGNKNTSLTTLELLLNDNACKRRIAGTKSTPVHILEALAKDDDIDIVEKVADNESVTPEILRRIISSNPPDSIPFTVLESDSLPLADLAAFTREIFENDIQLPDDLEESLFGRLGYEKDLPASTVISMSKNNRLGSLPFQRLAATCSNLPVKDILRLSKIEGVSESLEINPLLQVAVDKLYHLLSSGGVGSGTHFTSGEKWW